MHGDGSEDPLVPWLYKDCPAGGGGCPHPWPTHTQLLNVLSPKTLRHIREMDRCKQVLEKIPIKSTWHAACVHVVMHGGIAWW